jgi:hypothetical protein
MNRSVTAAIVSAAALAAVLPGSAGAQIRFAPAANYAAATRPDGLAIANFGGTSHPDMAVTADAPDRVMIRRNNGSGGFGAPVSVLTGSGTSPHALAALDFEGDGDRDLVVTLKGTNQVRVLINNGGVFTARAPLGVGGDEPRFLAVGDLDGNGRPDVVTSNRRSGDLSVMLNRAGTLGAPALYPVDDEPRAVALGRLNGDGRLDIAVAGHDGRAIQILYNSSISPGVFSMGPRLSVGSQLRPDGVAIADLDGDGRQDVIAATSGNGLNRVTVFFNQGSGQFAPARHFAAGGVNPGSVLAADLDRDGRRDIAVLNEDSANLSVLRNLGARNFAAPVRLAVGNTPHALVAADVDFRNGLDLACVNELSNSVSVLRNTLVK